MQLRVADLSRIDVSGGELTHVGLESFKLNGCVHTSGATSDKYLCRL